MPRMRDVIKGKARLNSRRKRVRHNTKLALRRAKLRGAAKKEQVRLAISKKGTQHADP